MNLTRASSSSKTRLQGQAPRACSGEVGTGSPTRTCDTEETKSTSRFRRNGTCARIPKGDQVMHFVRVLGPAAVAVGVLLGCGSALAASAEKGKEAFVKHGCWECHGFLGQGASTGPKLGPDP